MSRTKYQHYVPRFYLKKYCNSDGKVWVYDKHLDKIYNRVPDEIGGETYFYDVPELEKHMGVEQFVEKFFHPFEDKAAVILSTWLSKLEAGTYFRIYREQKALFALFLATQLLRTPNHRKFVMQMGARLKKIEIKAYLEAQFPEEAKKDFHISWDKRHEPSMHARSIITDSLYEFADILNAHIWIVLPNPTWHTLYTSDNPICKKAHRHGGWKSLYGIASEGIQLIFPLSPRFSLSLLERGHWKKFQKYDGKLGPRAMADESVDHDNSGQVLESTRFVYCQENDFALAKQVCIQYPDITDPKRQLLVED